MTIDEAKALIKSIVKSLEKAGVDHYTVSESRKGNSDYVELAISIKTDRR